MKIILSRKGFDSTEGGYPSPIDQEGNMMSFPIPGGKSPAPYSSITSPLGDMGQVVQQLSKGKIKSHFAAHLDPDLSPYARPRKPGWLASLGQTGAAQSHLAAQKVQPGDVFLFFGWFRQVQCVDQVWSYVPKAPQQHVLFGYLQIGESLHIGAQPNIDQILNYRPWLHDHPHMMGRRQDNNTLHIASEKLIINGRDTGLPGAVSFDRFDPRLVLTAPNCSKSVWAVPEWLHPDFGLSPLSYHADPTRWFEQNGKTMLRTVAKGQEFVFDIKDNHQALAWVHGLAQLAQPAPKASQSRKITV